MGNRRGCERKNLRGGHRQSPCRGNANGMKPLPRVIVFLLAATSIWCLLGEMYRLWPMRCFTLAVFVPECFALVVFAVYDKLRGDGSASRMILIGAIAGFLAAISYDIFRLPFVF